uniref:Uncharacterized protein n=1 Tax=Globodera rostochiensis TaxID=31243 RepID=A0A914I1L5_GLORO
MPSRGSDRLGEAVAVAVMKLQTVGGRFSTKRQAKWEYLIKISSEEKEADQINLSINYLRNHNLAGEEVTRRASRIRSSQIDRSVDGNRFIKVISNQFFAREKWAIKAGDSIAILVG